MAARPGLHIHTFGLGGNLADEGGHFADAYAPTQGDWMLVRPDGYIGAVVGAGEFDALEGYLRSIGLGAERRDRG